jgi:hypothetical protein
MVDHKKSGPKELPSLPTEKEVRATVAFAEKAGAETLQATAERRSDVEKRQRQLEELHARQQTNDLVMKAAERNLAHKIAIKESGELTDPSAIAHVSGEIEEARQSLNDLKHARQELTRLENAISANPEVMGTLHEEAEKMDREWDVKVGLPGLIDKEIESSRPLMTRVVDGLMEVAEAKKQEEAEEREKKMAFNLVCFNLQQVLTDVYKSLEEVSRRGSKDHAFYLKLCKFDLEMIMKEYETASDFLDKVEATDVGWFGGARKRAKEILLQHGDLFEAYDRARQDMEFAQAKHASKVAMDGVKRNYSILMDACSRLEETAKEYYARAGLVLKREHYLKDRDGEAVSRAFAQRPFLRMVESLSEMVNEAAYVTAWDSRAKKEVTRKYSNEGAAARNPKLKYLFEAWSHLRSQKM